MRSSPRLFKNTEVEPQRHSTLSSCSSVFDYDCYFQCPLTRTRLVDPVMITDGTTVERAAIEKWFEIERSNPLSETRLSSNRLIPNRVLKNTLDEFLAGLKGLALPDSFFCPISQLVFVDPVCTEDGHTYERQEIQSWLKEHDTSPNTGCRLTSLILTSNVHLRAVIEGYGNYLKLNQADTKDFGLFSPSQAHSEKNKNRIGSSRTCTLL